MGPFGIPLPEFLGNPQALRGLAQQLRGLGTQIGTLQSDLAGTVRGMTFEGKAADAFQTRTDGYGTSLTGAADQLQGFAGQVDAAADRIESEQRALAKLLEERRASATAGGP